MISEAGRAMIHVRVVWLKELGASKENQIISLHKTHAKMQPFEPTPGLSQSILDYALSYVEQLYKETIQ